MKKTVSRGRARSRKVMLRVFLRWFLYAMLLLLFYLWETNPMIKGFCPLLIIPLATAVAMREGELAAAVFGVFCGFMLDTASGTILGFSSLWLLVLCPVISLLAQLCVKVNAASHFVINFGASLVMGFLDFLFIHWVWEQGQSHITFLHEVLPAYLGAVIFSVPVYWLVLLISCNFRERVERHPEESSLTAEDAKDVVRE